MAAVISIVHHDIPPKWRSDHWKVHSERRSEELGIYVIITSRSSMTDVVRCSKVSCVVPSAAVSPGHIAPVVCIKAAVGRAFSLPL